jgi:ATP-binding cassette, subfamily F, member 3
MASVEPFESGECKLGHNTVLSYFAQHQADELNPNDSVFETLEKANSGQTTTQIRTALGAFLFHGDDVFKKTSVLSGGERNRLALSKILTQQANFLILDEPTNHLDMRSQDALQRALSEFEGAFLIVSHNRAFVDRIATKTLEVRKDGLSLFPGNVSDYLRHVEQLDPNPSSNQSNPQETSPVRKAQNLSPKERRQLRASMVEILSPLKKRSKELETKIAELEAAQEEFEAKMANPDFFKASDAAESMRRYDGNKKILEELYESWSQASDQVIAKEAELYKFAD